MRALLSKAILITLVVTSFGCVSQAVKDQAQTRVAISDGKARLIESGNVSKDDLIKMVLDDRKGWYSLNFSVNDGPEAPAPIVVPTATAEVR